MTLVERLGSIRFRRYSLGDIPGLLRTPTGRGEIRGVLLHLAFPVTARLASVYRRTALRRVRVAAVVGSYGKTTTARALMAALGLPVNPRVQLNSRAHIPRRVLGMRPGDRAAVLEIGIDGPGQMSPHARMVRPDITVVTSIGSEHGLSFKSIEATRHEKAEMVRVLAPDGLAVLNGDDPNVMWIATQAKARVITFGFGETNHVRASEPRLAWPDGTRFRLHARGEEREVLLRLFGRHMVYPALAAVAVALEEGHALDEILPRLSRLGPAEARLVLRRLGNGAMILSDELKSGVETIHAALDVLAEAPAGRKIVVLGPITDPPGSQGPLYRDLGARIGRIAQLAVFVDSFREYKGGVHRAGMPPSSLIDAGRGIDGAVRFLEAELKPGDVVLVKGRISQKLERIALSLEGRPVRCRLTTCQIHTNTCESCPKLDEHGN